MLLRQCVINLQAFCNPEASRLIGGPLFRWTLLEAYLAAARVMTPFSQWWAVYIVLGRDPRFVSEFWRLFARHFGIKRASSSAWHPHKDEQTERFNRTSEQVLRTYIQSRKEEWPEPFPALKLAYNCTSHSATGLSAFEVMLAENSLRPQNLDLADVFPPTLRPPMTSAFCSLLTKSWHISSRKSPTRRLLPTPPADHFNSPKVTLGRFPLVTLELGRDPLALTAYLSALVHKHTRCGSFINDHPPRFSRVSSFCPPPKTSGDGKSFGLGTLGRAPDGLPLYEVESILDLQDEGDNAQYLVK
ncbi:hypothetical protein Efla_001336 [Eimeria flavescens]